MDDRKTQHGLTNVFNKYICYCLILIVLTPYFNRNTSRFFIIVLIAGWLLSAVSCGIIPFRSRDYNICTIVIFFFISLELIYRAIGISTADWGNYLMSILSYLAIIIAMALNESNDTRYKRNTVYLALITTTVCTIDNIRLSFVYPEATVDINYSWGADYLKMNVAQTWFYFSVVLAAFFILSMLLNEKRTGAKIVELFALVSFTFFLFTISPRAIACLIFLVGVSSILILKFVRGNKALYFIIVFCFIVFYVFIGEKMILSIASDMSNERMRERLLDILSYSSGSSDKEGSMIGRISASKTSIATFFSSTSAFLFGVGYHVSDNAIRIGIGMHSGIVDMLPKYGLFGFVFFLTIIKKGVSAIRNADLSDITKSLQNVFIIAFLVYGILNQFLTPGICFAFFLLGINFKLIDRESENQS